MINFSTIKKNAYLLLLLCCLFTVVLLPERTEAQRKERKAAKAKKSTRVFYGQASFYSNKFNGKRTASGETFSQNKFTCACNVLPFGTWVKVTNLQNGLSVSVKVNDRIHPRMNRVTDLSRIAATKLGYVSGGLTRVKVEVLQDKKPI